jgi:hypothetical protein
MIDSVYRFRLVPQQASPPTGEAEGNPDMGEPIETTAATAPSRKRCLAPGCSCADGRILSRRHASFFAALAARNGQTANRVVTPETGWSIPVEPR